MRRPSSTSNSDDTGVGVLSRGFGQPAAAWFKAASADITCAPVISRRITRRLQARRTLRWFVAALCLAPFVGGWLVDHCPLQFRFTEAANLAQSWKTAEPPPDILLLGSSRLLWGIDNARLRDRTRQLLAPRPPIVFNGATFGGEPITMDFVSRKLLEARNAVPSVVVLEISPDTLARDNLQFIWPITRQMTAADLVRYAPDIILCRDGIPRLLSSRVTPFYRHRGELLAWATDCIRRRFVQFPNEQPRDIAALQAQMSDPSSNDGPERRVRRFEKHLRNYQLKGTTSHAFEDTVARFFALGSKIVLVQPPLTNAHRLSFGANVRAQFDPFLDHLRRAYGCDFVDLAASVPDLCFRDGDHVNDRGRPILTDLIATRAIAEEWTKLRPPQAMR